MILKKIQANSKQDIYFELLKNLFQPKYSHLIYKMVPDNLQSACAGHRCETALLRVYNDMIDRCNGAMLVLIDSIADLYIVQIDDVLSDFVNTMCGIPHCSVY